jgi:hypothetical protein
MTWFEDLTGFREKNPEHVRGNLHLDGERQTSQINGRRLVCGRLETPTLADLLERVHARAPSSGNLTAREVIADVQALHQDPANAGALFQVASQFNLLEMTSPRVTPEQGVGIYEYDHTQGPACAIAAGAGTLYRNYFVPLEGEIGQTVDRQIDCLADIGAALGNEDHALWEMRNGYALASRSGLHQIAERLRAADERQRDALRQRLRIGVQWDTQVTLGDAQHLVTQAYCSALPVAYTRHPAALWEPFARLVLEAAYEATLCTAILNCRRTGNRRVYLTLLGGGAFGNRTAWITESVHRALRRYAEWDLDLAVVSYGTSKMHVRELVKPFQR